MGDSWDIVVIGGGPAGATAAGLLAQGGLRVAVCEGKAFPREKVCGEFMGTRVRGVLERMGVLEEFDRRAGPVVRRVEAYAGGMGVGEGLAGAMPADESGAWPRGLGRGELDEMLLLRACEMGAAVMQPCHVAGVEGDAGRGFLMKTSVGELRGRAVVLAHGLARRGGMDGAENGGGLRRGYVSFKGHFAGCDLAEGTIAIGGAAGAYAGLVRTSGGRFSLAFVVGRERMRRLGNSAADQLAGLMAENAGFGRMLRHAERIGPWLASGPLEPGVRRVYGDGRFFVGNAAGEVHALVGEGITLAMRGAEILAEVLLRRGLAVLNEAGLEYERRWRREFAWRYGAAQVFANLMMRPGLAGLAGRVMGEYPELLAACIRRSGK